MPDLTLTVTDDQKTRIDAAFGALYPGETINDAFYASWIKRHVKTQVIQYESQRRNPDAAIASDLDSEGWNS
tara:strand:+ start:100 stop:315 length:216 start_codon:yes stop_codon:yes gene_type:complete